MIAMNILVYVVVEGLNTYLDSSDSHREHVIYMVSSRPVWPSLNRNSDIFHFSVLSDLLGFFKRCRLVVVESVQAAFHESLLVRARHEGKSASDQDKLNLVAKMHHGR